ncbi:N-acetyltransferase [Rhodanobacter sp. MP7CTX1]|uniref:GNAT family N-acetyltransferase n=1 Tax=Rhodanobacter sp. MP7CTX1 TaxID=2723084 RepID=UPI001618CB53|nr:N-acetyltransferase [Rhodanobacter sp. MP7CTX1]MBB6188727.1 ribosomal protein S18 acetylase RimI-like enzyme [Rhodanobacter sp. MP7CTX1]
MQTVAIRQLLGSDAAAWSAMRLESLVTDPFAFSGSVAEHMTLDVEMIEERFSHPADGGINLGAFKDQELVGMLIFSRVPGQKQRHKGRISALYVSSSQRDKGVAGMLLRWLFDLVKRDPTLEQIVVSVSASQQAACDLYRSFGFEIYGTEPRALKVGEVYIDSHDMFLQIADLNAAI